MRYYDSRPIAVIAGIWMNWMCVRTVKEGETTNDLFGFLTTEPDGCSHANPVQSHADRSDDSRANQVLPDPAGGRNAAAIEAAVEWRTEDRGERQTRDEELR
jgi:hypothetical protein